MTKLQTKINRKTIYYLHPIPNHLQLYNIFFTSDTLSLTYALEDILLVLTASDAISSNLLSGTPASESLAGIPSD